MTTLENRKNDRFGELFWASNERFFLFFLPTVFGGVAFFRGGRVPHNSHSQPRVQHTDRPRLKRGSGSPDVRGFFYSRFSFSRVSRSILEHVPTRITRWQKEDQLRGMLNRVPECRVKTIGVPGGRRNGGTNPRESLANTTEGSKGSEEGPEKSKRALHSYRRRYNNTRDRKRSYNAKHIRYGRLK